MQNSSTVDNGAFVITVVDGVKHYVRRKSISAKGRARVTMTTTNIKKALNFGSVKKATEFKDRLGTGYDIEPEQ